jgi:hypothetical protein
MKKLPLSDLYIAIFGFAIYFILNFMKFNFKLNYITTLSLNIRFRENINTDITNFFLSITTYLFVLFFCIVVRNRSMFKPTETIFFFFASIALSDLVKGVLIISHSRNFFSPLVTTFDFNDYSEFPYDISQKYSSILMFIHTLVYIILMYKYYKRKQLQN